MVNRILFEAFSSCYDPPHRVIVSLMDEGPCEVREAIRSALSAFPDEVIVAMESTSMDKAALCFMGVEPAQQLRLFLLCNELQCAIEQARIKEVMRLPHVDADPYRTPALADLPLDDEGLIPLSEFQIDGDALCINGHAFFVMPPVPGSNSSYWLLNQLQRNNLTAKFSVRLNPFLHGRADQLKGRHYLSRVWGRPLDWDRIRSLREPEFGRWVPGKMSLESIHTDYAWIPHDNEVDFLCEELPLPKDVEIRGARYLHAVYNKDLRLITHLDGAIRVYKRHCLEKRREAHVRNAGKVGTRIKIFRTDSTLQPEALSEIAQAFFYWNYDVARYFGEPVPDCF
jgi:hypothetical protein